MTVPFSETLPELGLSSPASRPSSVDLPEPEAPMMAANSPRASVKSIPLRMSTVVVPVRSDLRRASTTIIGLGAAASVETAMSVNSFGLWCGDDG